MAKKQIKDLIIRTRSEGSKEVLKEIQSIETSMDNARSSAKEFNRQMGGSIKVLSNVAKMTTQATKAISKMNTALNGNTKKSQAGMAAYADSIEIVTLYLRDLNEEAVRTANNLDRVGTAGPGKAFTEMRNFLESIEQEMATLNETMLQNTRYSREVRNNLTDLHVTADRTQEEIQGLANSTDGLTNSQRRNSKSAGKMYNDTRRLAGAGSQGARAFSDMAFRMNPLVTTYAMIAVNVYALSEAFRFLSEAAALDRLRDQTAQFAANISGIDIQRLSADLQELSGSAISAGDALRQSVRGVSYGFTVDEMERLTVGARKASVALGVNFTDAMDRAFRGISKGEIELLDEIGVVTRLDTAYSKYATTLNKRADDLTEVERRTALANEVLAQLEARFSSFEVHATGMEQLGVAVKDLTDNILILTSTNLDGYAKELASLIRGFGGVKSAARDVETAKKTLDEALAAGKVSQAAVAQDEYRQALEELRKESKEGTEEYKAYQKSVEEAQKAQSVMNKVLAAAAIAAGVYTLALAKSLIITTVSAAVGMYNSVITISSAVTKTYAIALGVATTATKWFRLATNAATLSLMAMTAPAWLVIAAITAVGVGIVALTSHFQGFVKNAVGGATFDAIAKFFNFIGEKISAFLDWLGKETKDFAISAGETISEGLDFTADYTGLSEMSEEFLKLKDSADKAIPSVDEYRDSLANISKNSHAIGYLLSGGLTRKEAEANIAYINNAKTAMLDLKGHIQDLEPDPTVFDKLASTLKGLAEIPLKLNVDTNAFEDTETRFENLRSQGIIPIEVTWDGGKGFEVFNERVQAAAKQLRWFTEDAKHELSVMEFGFTAGDPTADIQVMKKELEGVTATLQSQESIGGNINTEQQKQLRRTQELLGLEIQRKTEALAYQNITRAMEVSNERQLSSLERQTDIEYKHLELEEKQLKAKIATAVLNRQDTTELMHQLRLLGIRISNSKEDYKLSLQRLGVEYAMSNLEQKSSQAGTRSERVRVQQQILDLKRQEIALMPEGTEKEIQLMQLARERANLKKEETAAPVGDFGDIAGQIASLQGLTTLQSTFATSLDGISNTYADFLAEAGEGSSSFMDYLKNDIEAFGQVAQAGLAFAQQGFAQASKAKVDSLQREIEAEERRDGKSEESMRKIKQLKAKQIKEEAKAKKASVVMSTAAGIMQAFAQMGPFGAPFAAMIGAMGMMQLSQIDKAASGQVAGLNDGSGGKLAVTGGQRDNSIDVSKSSSAGELSFLKGDSGMGTANNFTPGRAVGNFARAGTRVTVGESGPEEITPEVPVNIKPAGDPEGSGKVVFAPVFNAHAIDQSGMDELFDKYSRGLYEGLEKELRAKNKTLDSI